MQTMAMKKRVNIALGIFLLVAIAAILVTPRSRDQLLEFVGRSGTAHNNPPDQPSTLEDAGPEADRDRAKSALGHLTGGTADIPELLDKLKDDDPPIREAAAQALAWIGKPAIPALVEALKHDEPRVRFGATRALALMKDFRVGSQFLSLMCGLVAEDLWPYSAVGVVALTLISAEEAKESIPALVDALDDPSSMVRFGAGRALIAIGTDAVPELIRGLKEPKQRVRHHSILVLSRFGDKAKDAIPALTAALSDKDIFVRSAAADALGAIGPIAKPAMPAIREAMKDKESLVSNRALEAKMRIDPDDYDRGILAMRSRDYDGAIRFFNKALGTNPGNAKYPLEPTQRESMTNEQKLMLEYLVQCHRGLAEAHLGNKDVGRALEHFDKWIQLRPNDANTLLRRGRIYHFQLSAYAKAVADYKRVLDLLPEEQRSASLHNDIAWILATCPKAEVRDGMEAIVYAKQACEIERNPIYVDTLAAAYAEAGNFEEAVRFQKEALTHPVVLGRNLKGAQDRLGLYESRKPYHEN